MSDPMGALFASLGAALDVLAAQEREAREARFNAPEARAARSARSRKAAATVRARRAAEEAVEAERWEREPTGPVCDAFGIILQAQETNCARPPHRRGDHEDTSGNRWPTYDEEFDDMLTVTTTHLRNLLDGPSENPVLYVARDEDTGEPVRLDVWDEALVHHGDIVARRHELNEVLGAVDEYMKEH